MSVGRIFLGDWGRIVRDPLDVMRLGFIGGTAYFAAVGDPSAIGLAASALLLIVARTANLPRPFDLALILALTLLAWGTALDLYGRFYAYDNVVHALAPLCYAPVLYIVLIRLGVLPDLQDRHEPHHLLGVFLVTLTIGMAVSAGYEVVEWISDSLFGTSFVKSIDDTGADLFSAICGSTIGAALLVVWSTAGFGTERRAPPHALTPRRRARPQSRPLLERARHS